MTARRFSSGDLALAFSFGTLFGVVFSIVVNLLAAAVFP
jgi:hypothetical protein